MGVEFASVFQAPTDVTLAEEPTVFFLMKTGSKQRTRKIFNRKNND